MTKELISRGYNVTAFAREKAGIKGKMSKDDTTKVCVPLGAVDLCFLNLSVG